MNLSKEQKINLIFSSTPKCIINRQTKLFNTYIKDILEEHFGSIKLIEGVDGLTDLDYGGIDAWSTLNKQHRSLSLRFSYTKDKDGHPWKTFTFRKYEFNKRIYAYENKNEGIHIPGFTVEFSFDSDNNKLTSMRYVLTDDLLKVLSKNKNKLLWKNGTYGEFLVVKVGWLMSNNVSVRMWDGKWDGNPLFSTQ